MRREVLRLCVFLRVRARSQAMQTRTRVKGGDFAEGAELVMHLPAAERDDFVASIRDLDSDLADALGKMVHERPERVPVEDVMEFVDLWLSHRDGGGIP